MLDHREILKSLDIDDRAKYLEHRTTMRRSYMAAHAATNTIDKWTEADDAFLDLIDIKLALLWDRSGRMDTAKILVTKDDATNFEDSVIAQASAATNLMRQPWPEQKAN